MSDELFDIKEKNFIEMKEKYGFTFVFTTKITTVNDNIASSEIKPLGIIYKKDCEVYFAPLSEDYNLKAITKKYVKENKTTLEEEYSHFQQ